jgi:hypothetical protein
MARGQGLGPQQPGEDKANFAARSIRLIENDRKITTEAGQFG